MATASVTFDDVRCAQERIRPHVHRTPVLTCGTLDRMAGARLFFKAESLQKAGAFKYRGATNAVQALVPAEAARGVATHSSGNHAQALSLAARVRGIAAEIVMPSGAPRAKVAAVEGYGGRITFCEPTLEARERALQEILAATGAVAVHPYDDARVVAGQGTAALELLEDVPELDAIVAPVGGGGLLSGSAIAAHGTRESIRVIGAEPELADDACRSLQEGRRLPPLPPVTVADGLRTALGAITFPIIRERVERIALASDFEILEAMRLLWERAKIIVEPSGAVPLAVLLARRGGLEGCRVGVILSGGNVDLCRNERCSFWR